MKKATKIIISIIAVIVVLGGIFAGLLFSGLLDYLQPKRRTWAKQVEKALNLNDYKLTDYAELLDDYKEIYKKPFKGSFNVSANIETSRLDKDLLNTLNNSKISIETAQNIQNKKGQANITLKSGDSEVINLETITDGTTVAISSKDIYDKYLVSSIGNISDVPVDTEAVADLDFFDLAYISKEDLKEIEKLYTETFKEEIDKDHYTKKANVKVDVDGKEVNTTAFYLTLSGRDAYRFFDKLAYNTRNNQKILNLLADKMNKGLEASGAEYKVDTEDVKNLLEDNEDSSLKELEDINNQGLQIAVYTKFGKPRRLEFNYVEDISSEKIETLLSIEYGKKKDIYSFNLVDGTSIKLIDEYTKKSKEEKTGKLYLEVKGTRLGSISYEFISKKAQSKIYLNVDVPLLDISGVYEISTKGNIKKEPIDVYMNLDVKYGKESAAITIDGTLEFNDEISISELTSENSVNYDKLSDNDKAKLMDEIMKNASKVLPDRLKLIGIDITSEQIYPTKKTIKPTTITTQKNTNVTTDDKIVAKKPTTNESIGSYTEIIEIGYNGDEIVSMTLAMEFADEEKAASIATLLQMFKPDELKEYEISQEGKKLVMKTDIDTFMKQQGLTSKKVSKDELKKSLKSAGYTVE